jgi:hypothetical protein
MRMNARRAGHDRRDGQDHAGDAEENTHDGGEGKRDARVNSAGNPRCAPPRATTTLHFRVTLPNPAPPLAGNDVQLLHGSAC